jgi:hypothetical protein
MPRRKVACASPSFPSHKNELPLGIVRLLPSEVDGFIKA